MEQCQEPFCSFLPGPKVISPMFLLYSSCYSCFFLACAEPTLVYMIFRVFHGNQVFCWHMFFAKLGPLSFAQPFAKVVQISHRNWISFHERLTGKTMFYSVFAKVLKLLICIFPPRGCRFFFCFLPFLKKHRKQRLGSGDKNCVVSHQWTQVHLPIYVPRRFFCLSTKQHNKQQRLTEKRDAYNSCDKCPDKELDLILLKTILNLLCVFRHFLLRAKLPQIGIRLKESDALRFQSCLPAAAIKNTAQTKQVKSAFSWTCSSPEVVR